MGSACSSSAAASSNAPMDLPPRPRYQPGDLIGSPVFESTRIYHVDAWVEEARVFTDGLCSLTNAVSALLLDTRIAAGLLQNGFSVALSPSPSTDILRLEVLTATGDHLTALEAAILTRGDADGRLAACASAVASSVGALSDFFARNSNAPSPGLALGASGALVSRTPGAAPDPAVERFNTAMLEMRAALGDSYTLALHIHKAQSHGAPAFRARLLKPSPAAAVAAAAAAAAPPDGADALLPATAAAAVAVAAAAAAAATGHLSPAIAAPPPPPPLFSWGPVTLLDLAGCRNAPQLGQAMHVFHEANGRLAAATKAAGLTAAGAVALTSPRTVALAGTLGGPTTTPPPAPHPTTSRSHRDPHARGRGRDSPATSAAAAAADAVRALPYGARAQVARSVADFNAAAHSLAAAAAAAPGTASFAALLTAVLGELRELVAAAGGDAALMSYKPSVQYSSTADLAITFALDPQLRAGWGLAPFPECLSPPVRLAWLLMQQLLRTQNAAVSQLAQLGRLADVFEEGTRRRIETVARDAAAARLPAKAAAAAERALARNYVELQACCCGALQTLRGTAQAVVAELAEAASLASLQCGLMSPLAWSISLASTVGPGLGSAANSAPNSLNAPPPGLYGSASRRGAAAAVGYGGNSVSFPPDTASDVDARPDQRQRAAAGRSRSRSRGRGEKSPARSSSVKSRAGGGGGGEEEGGGGGGSRAVSRALAGDGLLPAHLQRQQTGGSGWVAVEGGGGAGAAAADGAEEGAPLPPPPPRRSETLAEAYARSALEHLSLQGL